MEAEKNLQKVHRQKEKELMRKSLEMKLKQRDLRDNVHRMRRMDEYRKQLLLGKFNEKMKRADVRFSFVIFIIDLC